MKQPFRKMKRNSIVRVFTVMLLVLTMVFGLTPESMPYVRGAEPLTISGFYLKINGKPFAEAQQSGTEIHEGDKVSIGYNWQLSNNTNITEFEVNLGVFLTNIKLDEGNAPVFNSSGDKIGTVTIYYDTTENTTKAKYVIDASYMADTTSERHGKSELDGVIKVADSAQNDGKQVDVKFSDVGGPLLYYASKEPSKAEVYKGTANDSHIYTENGVLKQRYNIYVGAKNGTISDIKFTEQPSTKLSGISEVTVTRAPAELGIENTYSSIEALNNALSGKSLLKDQSLDIEYTMVVDKSIYQSNANREEFKNTVNVEYKDNHGTPNTVTAGQYPNYSAPTVNKNGVLNPATGEITWTIQINLNDYYEEGKPLGDILNYVKDTPGAGLEGANVPVDILSSFTHKGDTTYEATYVTGVEDSYLNSLAVQNVQNDVEIQTKDENKYTGRGTVQVGGTGTPIEKECTGYDSTNKKLTWQVTVHVPADISNMEDFQIVDDTQQTGGNHDIIYDVTVSDSNNPSGTKIIENGVLLSPNGVASKAVINPDYFKQLTFTFDNTYIAPVAGKDIFITYQTQINDAEVGNNEYVNKATLQYKNKSTGQNEQRSVDASWKDPNYSEPAVSKTGVSNNTDSTITYTVNINLANIKDLEADKEIVLTDVLPEGMELDTSATTAQLRKKWMYNDQPYSPDITPIFTKSEGRDAGEGKTAYDFTFEVTEQMVTEVAAGAAIEDLYQRYEPYIQLKYTAKVTDLITLLQDGTKSYTNTASGTYDGKSIGEASSTNSLTSKKAVEKLASYTENTAPYINYTVTVNPDRLNLAAGDKISASDVLGSALEIDETSIVVTNTKEGKELIKGTDYTVDVDGSKKSVTFSLPDQTPLKITYSAKVMLDTYDEPEKNEKLTPENSTNTFSLVGYTSEPSMGSKHFNQAAYTPKHSAGGKTGSITLFKYWTDGGTQVALNGSKFELYFASYDETKHEWVRGAHKKSIEITAEDGKIVLDNLPLDRIYVLYETEAKDGFVCNPEPYYFVLEGSDGVTIPDGVTIQKFSDKAEIGYENKEASKLKITKTLSGYTDWSVILPMLSFEVTDADGNPVVTVAGADMVADGANYSYTVNNLKAGIYTVTETVTGTITGYEYKSTSYVSSSGSGTGKTANVTTVEGQTENVTFTNEYEEIPEISSIVIKKTIAGYTDWDKVKDTLTFTVKASDGTTKATVTGNQLTSDSGAYTYKVENLPPDTYTVTETVSGSVAGYTLKTTTVSVDGATPVTGKEESVTTVNGDEKTVAFVNTYEALPEISSITIKKTIAGYTDWEKVKDTLTFTVKASDGTTKATVTGNRLTLSDGAYTYKVDNLPPDTYTVTETVSGSVTGYTLKTTTVSVDGAAQVTGKEGSVTTADGDEKTVAFVNTYEALPEISSIVIKKTIAGYTDWEKVKDTLTFTVKASDGTTKATVTGNRLTLSDGAYTYKVDNLPPDTYTVTETVSGSVTGYTLKTTTVSVDGATPVTGKEGSVTTVNGDEKTVAFVNTYEALPEISSITIKKTIAGYTDWDKVKDTLTFTVKASDGTTKATVTGNRLTLSDGAYTYKVDNLPPDTYTVTETVSGSVTGYTLKTTTVSVDGAAQVTGKEGSVTTADGDEKTVAFVNTYEALPEISSIVIKKTIAGYTDWDKVKDTLTFTVKASDGTTKATVTGNQLTSDSGAYTYKVDNLPPDTYLVMETVKGTVEGYKLKSTKVSVGDATPAAGISESVTTIDGDEKVVTFVNTYEEIPQVASIVVKKTITGYTDWDAVKGTLKFVVSDENGTEAASVAGSQLVEESGVYTYTFTNLTPGEYSVKEVVTGDVEEYTLTETSYQIDGAQTTKSGTEAEVVLVANQKSEISYTNKYTKNETPTTETPTTETPTTETPTTETPTTETPTTETPTTETPTTELTTTEDTSVADSTSKTPDNPPSGPKTGDDTPVDMIIIIAIISLILAYDMFLKIKKSK